MEYLSIDCSGNSLRVEGDINHYIKSRHRIFLKRSFKASIENNHIIINDIKQYPKLASDLVTFFEKNKIPIKFGDNFKQTYNLQLTEEESFKEFSIKARNIWNNIVDIEEFEEFQKILSENMDRTLYERQLLSAYHLAFSKNAANFSVPGAGKTSTVYGAFAYLKNIAKKNERINKILVVGPLSSFAAWENEYAECFGEKVKAKRLSGGTINGKQKKHYLFSDDTSILTLISYQGLINQKENLEFFLKNNNVMLVLDEAHKIKNTHGGSIADTALSLAIYAKSRVILTGTPAPNGYKDLYNLFKFIWPHKNVMDYNIYQLENLDEENSERLIDNISPYFIRISKKDLNLPPKIENTPIKVPMSPLHNSIYKYIEQIHMKELDEESDSYNQRLKSARLIRLMQAASNPGLLLKPIYEEYGELCIKEEPDIYKPEIVNNIIEFNKKEKPYKFYEALALIKEIIKKKERVIVWAIYVDTILEFSEFLKTNNIACRKLYGETPIEGENTEFLETREKIVNEFNGKESSFDVIIANPFAVAESISLHKGCHNAIYLEKNFDSARFLQSKDRIHRYGLEEGTATNYYYILGEETVEETIHQRLLEKEELMVRIMESREIPLFKVLDEEIDSDVRAVLNDYKERTAKS